MLTKRDPDIIKSYFEDSSNLQGGYAQEVIIPENITELSRFLADASTKKIPVTISGGGTSTTGSRVPFGGVVVSMERFNRIIGISSEKRSAYLEAGVPVEDFKDECEKAHLFYASHPTERTALMGGTVATNASGARSFRYGPTRNSVKYLKMVLANGSIFEIRRGETFLTHSNSTIKTPDGLSITIPLPSYRMPAVKNSAGYFARDGMDLIDLFIGQEGTLAAIVEMELALADEPHGIFSSFVFFTDEKDAFAFADDVRRGAGGLGVLSIEYFDYNSLVFLSRVSKNVPRKARAAIFFEQEPPGDPEGAFAERWGDIVAKHNASLDDTWVAMTEKEAEDFIELRHAIPEALNDIVRRRGYAKPNTDLAVPGNNFEEMTRFYMDTFKRTGLEHLIFGHIGDYHLHTNILPRSAEELERAKGICYAFAKKAVELGGTVSAEHGIGKTRREYLEVMYGKEGILEMARIKKALDPNSILGLDNIFPKELLESV